MAQSDEREGGLRTIDADLVDEVVRTIVEHENPEKIIVFGSAAREATVPGSDIDLLIVEALDETDSPWARAREIRKLFRGWRVPLDIVVLTPRQFERGVETPGHLAHVADRTGTIAHERE